jgi:hypothetical protein
MDAVVLVPLLAVIVFLALYPQGALKRSESSANASVAAAHAALSPFSANLTSSAQGVPATNEASASGATGSYRAEGSLRGTASRTREQEESTEEGGGR